MILALWLKWRERKRLRYLVLVGAVLVADAIVGPAIIAWEIGVAKDMLEQW